MPPDPVEFREMTVSEVGRIREVDRAETVRAEYRPQTDDTGLGLVAHLVELPEPMLVPAWDEAGVATRASEWGKHLDRGGWMFGAFERDRLIGFVILGPRRTDASGEIVALFVDKNHRRRGVGRALMGWAEQQAALHGIEKLFLYANPTESSTGFYLAWGFSIAGLISKEVVATLPGDIVMTKALDENDSVDAGRANSPA